MFQFISSKLVGFITVPFGLRVDFIGANPQHIGESKYGIYRS